MNTACPMLIRGLHSALWAGMVMALGCFGPSARGDAQASRTGASLEIVSVPWDIQTRGALTERTILTFSEARMVTITDPQALQGFQERLRTLRFLGTGRGRPVGGIRIFARLKHGDGTMERLSIPESCDSMIRDGAQCSFDPELFGWILSRLSVGERETLARYPACSIGK